MDRHDTDDAGRALGDFGALLLDAGYAVSDVAATMRQTARARSLDAVVGVLPQAVLVDDSGAGHRRRRRSRYRHRRNRHRRGRR